MLLLLKNPTFVCLCLAGATEATLIAGMSTFGPKFLESQFSLSASEAATWFGGCFILFFKCSSDPKKSPYGHQRHLIACLLNSSNITKARNIILSFESFFAASIQRASLLPPSVFIWTHHSSLYSPGRSLYYEAGFGVSELQVKPCCCRGSVLVLKAPSSDQLILTRNLAAVQRRCYRREFSVAHCKVTV